MYWAPQTGYVFLSHTVTLSLEFKKGLRQSQTQASIGSS